MHFGLAREFAEFNNLCCLNCLGHFGLMAFFLSIDILFIWGLFCPTRNFYAGKGIKGTEFNTPQCVIACADYINAYLLHCLKVVLKMENSVLEAHLSSVSFRMPKYVSLSFRYKRQFVSHSSVSTRFVHHFSYIYI